MWGIRVNINLIAPINDLGYGYTGLHITDELVKMGVKVALFPIGKPYCHFRHQDNIEKALNNADCWDNKAPCIRLWHQHDMSMFVGHGKHIGFPIFELDTFTGKETFHLSQCDDIFVCSKWAKRIVDTNVRNFDDVTRTWSGGPLSKVVPLGVDPKIFTPKLSRRKPTIFFNCGKWEVRKGHLDLALAFSYAFKPDDDVELWMMCHNPFLTEEENQEWINYYKSTTMGHKIRFLPRVEADMQVAEIMQQADCGVFPSKAEGWNLEALEMLACGKQVIATEYSAHTEFLTEDNSFLVPITGVVPAYDRTDWMPDKWFMGQGNWGLFDQGMHRVDDITGTSMLETVVAMQTVHTMKKNGDLELNEEGIETAQKYSWRNTAETLIHSL
jgi:glycosyltransferase involved in cell wall biosynthesis